ncbi:hypothetical protein HK103_007332 [Boothiomyces macroporosus]|uniref:Rho-GAP domain-containing protein n=1 Tax=Boothiomyces macroporosus TaxID=261099 RepID=A0AAD5UKV7_9FUNG|nr:hypothetical protein HK103_007332 [Boothiomyces macroporosus]
MNFNHKITSQFQTMWSSSLSFLREFDAAKKTKVRAKAKDLEIFHELVRIELGHRKTCRDKSDVADLKTQERNYKKAVAEVKKEHQAYWTASSAKTKNPTKSLGEALEKANLNVAQFATDCNSFAQMVSKLVVIPDGKAHLNINPTAYVPEEMMFVQYPSKAALNLVFSVPLDISNNGSPNAILNQLYAVIETRGIDTEGVYRVPAKASEIKALQIKAEASEGNVLGSLDQVDINVVAGLIKHFFRQLPQDLFVYPAAERITNSALPPPERVSIIKEKISSIPAVSESVLKELLISTNACVNKMTAANLGMVLSAVLFNHQQKLEHESKSAYQSHLLLKNDLVAEDMIEYCYELYPLETVSDHVFVAEDFLPAVPTLALIPADALIPVEQNAATEPFVNTGPLIAANLLVDARLSSVVDELVLDELFVPTEPLSAEESFNHTEKLVSNVQLISPEPVVASQHFVDTESMVLTEPSVSDTPRSFKNANTYPIYIARMLNPKTCLEARTARWKSITCRLANGYTEIVSI